MFVVYYIHVQVYWIITFAPRAGDDPLKKATPARIPQGYKQKQTKTYERNFDTLSHTI